MGLLYSIAPVYNYPDPQLFHGSQLYNPYADLKEFWWKGNFQVASYSWGGVTDGRDTADDVYQQYRKYGYDIISISDYQKINRFRSGEPDYVPTYERGYNVWKRHHLCIGAQQVNWYDLPLFQTVHHKQYIINLTKPNVEFLTIAHPIWMKAYTPEDLSKLSGYDALEVLNHYRNSLTLWEAALSAGKKVWMIGNDDSHNVFDLEQTMRYWTMINAQTSGQSDILSALKAGRSYGVDGRLGVNQNNLNSLTVDSQTIYLELDTIAVEIKFIGQNGQEKAKFLNLGSAHYTLTSGDSYIRTEIRMDQSKIYLNPVFRYENAPQKPEEATINWPLTWLYRFLFFLVYGTILFLVLKQKKIITKLNFMTRK
jgi:hypothetical protein